MASLWIFAALGSATCFAVSSLLAYDAARALGAIAFSFVRVTIVAVGFGVMVLILGFDTSLRFSEISLLLFSGFLGAFLSDSFRYASLVQIGPSLQSLLSTATAPFALVMGFFVLGQLVTGMSLIGTAVVIGGLILAVYSRNSTALTHFSGNNRKITRGVLCGLGSALTQAGSIIVAAPVMIDGTDLISATFVRSFAGAVSLLIPVVLSSEKRKAIVGMSFSNSRQVALSAMIGTGLGMTLQLYALGVGPAGIVSTLTATTPLIILPLVWILGKARPPALTWIGSICAVLGVALIVNAE